MVPRHRRRKINSRIQIRTLPLSVFAIAVNDVNGKIITDGIILTEKVTPVSEAAPNPNSNPREMGPLPNGIFPDIVGMGETSSRPYDPKNPAHVKHAADVIQTGVSTPTNETTRQTLTITGCGSRLVVVNERTQSNLDPNGNVRPFLINNRLVNNFSYSIRTVYGPLRVFNRP